MDYVQQPAALDGQSTHLVGDSAYAGGRQHCWTVLGVVDKSAA